MGDDISPPTHRLRRAQTVDIAIRTVAVGVADRSASGKAMQLHSNGLAAEAWFQIDGPFREELELAGVRIS